MPPSDPILSQFLNFVPCVVFYRLLLICFLWSFFYILSLKNSDHGTSLCIQPFLLSAWSTHFHFLLLISTVQFIFSLLFHSSWFKIIYNSCNKCVKIVVFTPACLWQVWRSGVRDVVSRSNALRDDVWRESVFWCWRNYESWTASSMQGVRW